MVAPYISGQKVDWAVAEAAIAKAERVELRNDAGRVVGVVVAPTAADGGDPDWVRAITPDEIARRMAEPGYTFEELKKRLGWE